MAMSRSSWGPESLSEPKHHVRCMRLGTPKYLEAALQPLTSFMQIANRMTIIKCWSKASTGAILRHSSATMYLRAASGHRLP